MAVNSTPFTAGNILTATQMTNLPMGLNANAGATASTAFVAGTALTVLSVSATIYANRSYQIFGKLAVQFSTTGLPSALYVTGNSISRTLYYQTEAIASANYNLSFSGFTVFSAADLGVTSGSAAKTIALIFKSGGAGFLNTNPDTYVSAGSFSQELLVIDIGGT